MAPYRAVLRYYRRDSPYRAILFKEGERSPNMVRYPWYLVSYRHIGAVPRFAAYRAIIVRYPIKTSTKEFCDTITTSIARYEKYRSWASKKGDFSKGAFCRIQNSVSWPRKQKLPKDIGASLYMWHSKRHSQERRTLLQNPLLKTPFLVSPNSLILI